MLRNSEVISDLQKFKTVLKKSEISNMKRPQILLRNIPDDIYNLILKKKLEIQKKTKRPVVSYQEAIVKLIKQCNPE